MSKKFHNVKDEYMLAQLPEVLASPYEKQPHVSGNHLATCNSARPVRSNCAILLQYIHCCLQILMNIVIIL